MHAENGNACVLTNWLSHTPQFTVTGSSGVVSAVIVVMPSILRAAPAAIRGGAVFPVRGRVRVIGRLLPEPSARALPVQLILAVAMR